MIFKENISMRKNQAGAFYAQTSLATSLDCGLHIGGAKCRHGEKFRVLHNFCG
jgi:hypothetical protein